MDDSTRQRFNLARTAALALMSAAVTAACDGGAAPSAGECRTFRTTLSVNDRMSQVAGTFNPGEPITFELQIANTWIIPAKLVAGWSCEPVVFEVFDASKLPLWSSADGIVCLAILDTRTFSPLEVVTESSTWNQTSSGSIGVQVPSGDYTVTAHIAAYVPASQGLVDCRPELGQTTTTFRIL